MNKETDTHLPYSLDCSSLFTLPFTQDADPKHALDGITRTLLRWAEAIRRKDIEALARLLTTDAEFWTHGAPPLHGRHALAAALRPIFDRFNMEQRFDCVELILSGKLAILRGREVNRLTDVTCGDSRTIRQRALSVLTRDESGEWLFARGMTNLSASGDESGEN